jgi:hypothetical protein
MKDLEKISDTIYGPNFRVLKTGKICEWVSATGPFGMFQLRLPNGKIAEFHRNEIDPATPEEFIESRQNHS